MSVDHCPGYVVVYSSKIPREQTCARSTLFHDAFLIGETADYRSALN
jgi:hypothetical protein